MQENKILSHEADPKPEQSNFEKIMQETKIQKPTLIEPIHKKSHTEMNTARIQPNKENSFRGNSSRGVYYDLSGSKGIF